jgi:CRP/FNR family transcriptional regulator, cyclic AMP receptor protein
MTVPDDIQDVTAGNRRHSLKNIKLFDRLEPEAIREIEGLCRWYEYGPNDVVLEREDPSQDVFFIAYGTVRVMNYLGNEREVALADLHAGDHFGELSAVDSKERSARVVGSDECVIASLKREDFLTTLAKYPAAALRLLEYFAGIIRAMNARVSSLSTLSPRQRIYVELLRISEPHPQGDGSWIIPTVPAHKELAAWAGTDQGEVASAIGALVREGIMERRNRSYLIKDQPRLRLLATL